MGTLLTLLLTAIILPGFIVSVVLLVTISSLNVQVIRHQAMSGNYRAKRAYPLLALGRQLSLGVFIVSILFSVLLTSVLLSSLPGLAGIVASVISHIILLVIVAVVAKNFGLTLLSSLQPILSKYYAIFGFILRPASKLVDNWLGVQKSSVQTKEDLVRALKELPAGNISGIAADELRILRQSLEFGNRTVRDVMTPRKMVVTVHGEDAIGPILLDELHKSGHSRFPVVGQQQDQFIGILYLHDLVGAKVAGTINTLMHDRILYIHEETLLTQALRAFLKHNNHLFIVVNSFEEFVGVVSLEDVIEEILGKEIVDEFDQHTDLRAAARALAQSESEGRINISHNKAE